MKKIKNNYTKFILTVIAIAMIGILFKGQIIKPAYASCHDYIGERIEVIIKNQVALQKGLVIINDNVQAAARGHNR